MRRTLLAMTTLAAALATAPATPAAEPDRPTRVLIITGDHGHKWKETTPVLKDMLAAPGRVDVDVTTTPAKDLTDENLAKYDVLLLNYANTKNGPPETQWSDANKEAFLKAVKDGKGLVVYHFASAAFARPTNWVEFEKAIAGGWRTQGYHGPAHEFKVKKTPVKHPISEGLPAEFDHAIDELYSASMRTPGSLVLATAYADPDKPKGTGMDEAVVWVNQYGKGRVVNIALGHDVTAISDPFFKAWLRRSVEWAATGQVASSTK